MIIELKKREMELLIHCGITEAYKPSKDTKSINKKVNSLKKKMDKFQEEVMAPAFTEIEELIKQHNKKFVLDKKTDKIAVPKREIKVDSKIAAVE